MAIKPEDLLACAEDMTDEQRARFCELLDPAPADDVETEVDSVACRTMKQNVREMLEAFNRQGARNDPHSLPIAMVQRVADDIGAKLLIDASQLPHLFRPPSPELVAQFLYGQMTGKKLPAESIALASDNIPVETIEPAMMDRWARARERWERLFGETHVPMVSKPETTEADINVVEGLLYDKEVKGTDPVRCSCGCGYVHGCGGFMSFQDMEE